MSTHTSQKKAQAPAAESWKTALHVEWGYYEVI